MNRVVSPRRHSSASDAPVYEQESFAVGVFGAAIGPIPFGLAFDISGF